MSTSKSFRRGSGGMNGEGLRDYVRLARRSLCCFLLLFVFVHGRFWQCRFLLVVVRPVTPCGRCALSAEGEWVGG